MHVRPSPSRQAKSNSSNQAPQHPRLRPCLFRHITRDIMFSLVVDDFGVRYTKQASGRSPFNSNSRSQRLQVEGPTSRRQVPRQNCLPIHAWIRHKMLQRFRPQYLLPGHRPAKTPGRYIAPSYIYQRASIHIHRQDRKTEPHTYHGTAGNHHRRHTIILR